MELETILTMVGSLLGGGSLGGLLGWRMQKRKQTAEVKSDEIENMRKAMADFYDPLVERQNKRIAELEDEVKTLREQLNYERTEHQAQIAALQKQIVEITRVLGIKANKQVRNERGQFAKPEGEAAEG